MYIDKTTTTTTTTTHKEEIKCQHNDLLK